MKINIIYILFLLPLAVFGQSRNNRNRIVKPRDKAVAKSVAVKKDTVSIKKVAPVLLNALRQKDCKCGEEAFKAVANLKWQDTLAKTAQVHATDMHDNNYFNHISKNGDNVSQRAEKEGLRLTYYVGENISYGQVNIAGALKGWMDSEGHCENIMNKEYTHFGLARKGDVWVMVLANLTER